MKAAFYECDITPPLGCYSVGYGVERIAEDVYDRLYSKALVLEQSGSYAVIISVDMCEYPDDITDIVTGRILKYTGIAPESVCITATHTHYGAPVMDSPEINCFGDSCYKDVFCRLVADSAILAFKRLKPAKLHYGKASVDGVAYSRCHYMKDGSLKSFFPVSQPTERPLTEPDTELPALFVEQDGELAGVLYCFCCHQDTVSAKNPFAYSGDYSSEVSDILKKKYGHNFVSMYLPGPCGDVNHINIKDTEHILTHREIGRKIAEGVCRAQKTLCPIDGNITSVKETVTASKRTFDFPTAKKLMHEFSNTENSVYNVYGFLNYFMSNRSDNVKLYIQVIAIGDFAIHIYPGEMFVQYSYRTKQGSPYTHVMVVENSNSFGGYIPIPEAFGDNTDMYETSPSWCKFVVPETGEILLERMLELSRKAIASDKQIS